ncbi:MAG: BlaI/MecI/CopY family transcriptional regulator [Pirellulaceae bacterium]
MPRPASEQPTEVELQILNVLWDHGPSTVREIHTQLSQHKDTNYSTTVKMLSVMLDKDLVRRDESVRPQIFRAAVTRNTAQKKMLKGLIHKVYEGSAKSLVLQALSTQKASKQDLAEIRQLLDELEGETP